MVSCGSAKGFLVDLQALEQESRTSRTRLPEAGPCTETGTAVKVVLPSPAGFGRRRESRRAAKGNSVAPLQVPLGNGICGAPLLGSAGPVAENTEMQRTAASSADCRLPKATDITAQGVLREPAAPPSKPNCNLLEVVRVERDLLRHRCQELAEQLAVSRKHDISLKGNSQSCESFELTVEEDLCPLNLSTALVAALGTPSPRHLKSEATAALHYASSALGPGHFDVALVSSLEELPEASPHPVPADLLPSAYEELRTNFYRAAAELMSEMQSCSSLSEENQKLREALDELSKPSKRCQASPIEELLESHELRAEVSAATEDLKTELNAAKEECRTLRVQNGALFYNDRQMSQQCKALHTEVMNENLRGQNLQVELSESTQEVKALKAHSETMLHRNKEMSFECESLHANEMQECLRSQYLQAELRAAAQESEGLRTEELRAVYCGDELQREVAAATKELKALHEASSSHDVGLQDLRLELSATQDECKELQQQKLALLRRDEALLQETGSLRAGKNQEHLQCQSLHLKLDAVTLECKGLRTQSEALQLKNAQMSTEMDDLAAYEANLGRSQAKPVDVIGHLFEGSLKETESELSAASLECEVLREQKEALLCRNQRLVQAAEQLHSEEIEQRLHGQDLQDQLDSILLESEVLRTQKEASQSKNKEMSKELEEFGAFQTNVQRNSNNIANSEKQELQVALHEQQEEIEKLQQTWETECGAARRRAAKCEAEAGELRAALGQATQEAAESGSELSELQCKLAELQQASWCSTEEEDVKKQQRSEFQAALIEIRDELNDCKAVSADMANVHSRLGEALEAVGVDISGASSTCPGTTVLADEAARVLKRQQRRCILLGGRVAELQEEHSRMELSRDELQQERRRADESLQKQQRLEELVETRGVMLEEAAQEKKSLELRLLQEARLRETLRAQLTQFTSQRKSSRERARSSSSSAPRINMPGSRVTTPGSSSEFGSGPGSAEVHRRSCTSQFTFPHHRDNVGSDQLWSNSVFGDTQRCPLGEITHCTNSMSPEDGMLKRHHSMEPRRLRKSRRDNENNIINNI